jgi:hypothetical protein
LYFDQTAMTEFGDWNHGAGRTMRAEHFAANLIDVAPHGAIDHINGQRENVVEITAGGQKDGAGIAKDLLSLGDDVFGTN